MVLKELHSQEISCQYSSTSIFTVVLVYSESTRGTNTRINQSTMMVATMMQQRITITKLIIVQTYQLFRIKSVFMTVNNELLIEKESKNGWAKGV